ncbi:gamma-glutamylcyclotransferase [Flavobacterium zhairuonense]|uniref:gamma-glutamylcyclotransferase n=1 Tax=Flavobacterium zhairuonense TaxID=2493631 RepID=UPI001044D3CA|nr:gamma-glutamylcyclotransferase [Flavobacterium zhairuonense]KAF2506948.1 gamma-glutamylcyclotransferase [Flavobacterium zhairuonense]
MEQLFSYGTLQLEKVQLETFGRILKGEKVQLKKYELGETEIKDQSVIEKSGKNMHPIAKFTGNETDSINGVLFEITYEELLQSDEYEVEEYERVKVAFDNNIVGWAYVCKETNRSNLHLTKNDI